MPLQLTTLQEYIDYYLQGFKESTRHAYHHPLQDLAAHIGGDTPLAAIAKLDVDAFRQTVQRRDITAATKRKIGKVIKSFFNRMVELGVLAESPAAVWKLPKLQRTDVDRDKAMSDAELRRVLVYLESKRKYRDVALLLFLADTGARAGGAAGLTLDDLDLHERKAVVTEKGDKTRVVRFGQRCATALNRWILLRDPRRAGAQLFANGYHGQGITSAAVSQIVRRACLDAGVQSRGAHALRHRKGHQLADSGVPVSVASNLLGHALNSITLDYYYPDTDERVVEAFDNLAWGGGDEQVEQPPDKVIDFQAAKRRRNG